MTRQRVVGADKIALILGATRRRLSHDLQLTLFGVAPLLIAIGSIYVSTRPSPPGWHHAVDFHTFWTGGREYAHGRSPYPTGAQITHARSHAGQFFVYPAPMAAFFAPLGLLPFPVAAILFTACSVVVIASALWLLDVRDWRCYGAAFVSPAVMTSITVGTLTPLLVLGVAVLWRWRDRAWAGAVTAALLLLAKLFLWPLLLWFIVTRRGRVAGRAVLLAALASVLASVPIGLKHLTAYPGLLRALSLTEGHDSYQPLWLMPGTPQERLVLVELAAAAAAVCILALGRRLSERRLFGVCVVTALAASPIVWLHYLALLVPVTAIVSRRLALVWLAPLTLWATPVQLSSGAAWRVALAAGVVASVSTWRLLPRRNRTTAATMTPGH